MKIKKLAIFSPGFLPVPDVKGGAIEQLITYFINENEVRYQYDIDLYTIDDILLNDVVYKHTRLIKIKKISKVSHISHAIQTRFAKYVLKKETPAFLGKVFAKKYIPNYYDEVLIENNMDILEALLPVLKKEKIYFHLHNDFGDFDVSKSIAKTQIMINNVDKILVVSNFLKNKLEKMGAKNIIVVPNAINIDLQKKEYKKGSMRKKIGFVNQDIVFTFIGRLVPEKGIIQFLNVFKENKLPSNIKGLVVGETSKGVNVKNTNNVKYVGYVPNKDIDEVLSITDCIVVPTQIEEAFGIVALEAMALEVPIIAADSGNLPYLLEGTGAPIVNRGPNFEKELKESMMYLANDNLLRSKIGANEKNKSKNYPLSSKEYANILRHALSGE